MAFIIIDRLQEEQRLDFDKLRRLGDSKSFRAAIHEACLEHEQHGALSKILTNDRYGAVSALEKLAAMCTPENGWPAFNTKDRREIIGRGRVDELQSLGEQLANERHVHLRRRVAPELRAAYARIVDVLAADLREASRPSRLDLRYAVAPTTSTLCLALTDAISVFKNELERLEASELGFGRDIVWANGPRNWFLRFFNEPI
jgi:hypothetical protein